jgi:hypothetical protein
MKDICLWSHISLTREMNACMHWLHLNSAPTEDSTTTKTKDIIRLKPKECLRKYDDTYSQLQILYHSVSTYSLRYLERINL